jgi:hypothetical protein
MTGGKARPDHGQDERQATEWVVRIECAGNALLADGRFADKLADLEVALRAHEGVVHSSPTPNRFGATLTVRSDTPCVTEATLEAVAVFLTKAEQALLPPWPVVRCEIMTSEEQADQLYEPPRV